MFSTERNPPQSANARVLQTRCSSPIFESGCVGSRDSARAASLCCRDRDPRSLFIAAVPSRRPYRRFATWEAALTAALGQSSRADEHCDVPISSDYRACPIIGSASGLHPSRFESRTIYRFPAGKRVRGLLLHVRRPSVVRRQDSAARPVAIGQNIAASSRKNTLRLRNESPRTTWNI